jgi:hypothetical protein
MSWLLGVRRSEILTRYNERFAFERDKSLTDAPPDEQQILAALAAMEVDRNEILDALRTFDRKRIRQKFRGNRQLSKAEKKRLSDIRCLTNRGAIGDDLNKS